MKSLNMSDSLLLIDFGTSRIKYILRDLDNLSYFNQGGYKSIEAIIHKYYSLHKCLEIITIGSNAKNYIFDYPTTNYDELTSIAHLPQYYGCKNALIVNIGTGTSFSSYKDGEINHLIGTGLGGGTILGLAHRLLDSENINIIDELAKNGELSAINTIIGDIDYQNRSWLDPTMTVSNFNKPAPSQSDIASGIISLVIEPIISITKSLLINNDYNKVYFSGSVLVFSLLRDLIYKYSKIFDINTIIIDKYEYGTLLGALAYHDKMQDKL